MQLYETHKNSSQKREEAAVYAAAELFLTRGIEAVTMTDVAAQAGVGVATLYRRFGTKEALVIRAGSLLWEDLRVLFAEAYQGPGFTALPGVEQIARLLDTLRALPREHPDFLRFLADFDAFVTRGRVEGDALREYERRVFDFYPVFLQSYETGVRDGTVRPLDSPRRYYDTVCHAVIALGQKLLQGDILPGDDARGCRETDLLVDMALDWIRTDRR